MKRFLGLLSLTLVLVGMSVSHLAFADTDPNCRALVCHVSASRTLSNGRTTVIGTIREVSCSSLPGHLAHGDTIALSGSVGDCCAYCITQAGLFCPPNID